MRFLFRGKLAQCMAKRQLEFAAKFVFSITVLYFMVFTFELACLVFPLHFFALQKHKLGTFLNLEAEFAKCRGK